MAIDATRKSRRSERLSSLRLSAGASARHISHSQKVSPTKSRICQKRPKSTYSYPCAPNQNQYLPRYCSMPSHSPLKLPTTTSSTAATKKNLKVARCDGVVFSPVSGSVLGTSPCSVWRVCEPKYQTMPPTPASRSTKLMTLQTTEPPVTLFPTRGSCGQFCV